MNTATTAKTSTPTGLLACLKAPRLVRKYRVNTTGIDDVTELPLLEMKIGTGPADSNEAFLALVLKAARWVTREILGSCVFEGSSSTCATPQAIATCQTFTTGGMRVSCTQTMLLVPRAIAPLRLMPILESPVMIT